MSKGTMTNLTAEHKRLLEDFVNKTIELKRKEYHSTLEPFDSYAAKLKKKMYDHFLEFYESFMNGYTLLQEKAQEK